MNGAINNTAQVNYANNGIMQTVNPNNNNAQPANLDVIAENTGNIERASNSQQINIKLNQAIKQIAAREKENRRLTLTFNQGSLESLDTIIDEIELHQDLTKGLKITWKDKKNAYVKVANKEDKDQLVLKLKASSPGSTLHTIFQNLAKNADNTIAKLARRPARLEIQNVTNTVQLAAITEYLEYISGDKITFTEIKEGKTVQRGNSAPSRLIMFKANARGIELIYKTLGGALQLKQPIQNSISSKRTMLFPRINIKPFVCRDCFNIGSEHKCPGKVCTNCGSKDHKAATCPNRTRYCTNCKKGGHRARDTHCTKYLNELAKEMGRIDIPLDMLENTNQRAILIKNLQLN